MALLQATEIGLFRANPNANVKNTMQLVDPDTPGTTGTDTLARNVATAPDVQFEGVTYQGKDGVEVTERFFYIDGHTGEKHYYVITANADDATAEALQKAILLIVEQYEVDPVVSVSLSTTTFTIVHTGAGTMDDVVIDGSAVATTRT